jgi:hypothetical protein
MKMYLEIAQKFTLWTALARITFWRQEIGGFPHKGQL